MKKALAIILALLMVLSLVTLAACGKKEETKDAGKETKIDEKVADVNVDDTVTEEMLKNSKPNEYVFEKLEAGYPVEVGFFGQNNNYFVAEQLLLGGAKLLQSMFPDITCTQILAEDNSITSQLTQMENAVTQGTMAGMCVQTSDPAALEKVVLEAQDKGITVIIYGIECEYETIVAMADVYNAGYGIGVMASAWADVRYPDAGEGDIKTALLGGCSNVPNLILTQGMRDSIYADNRFNVIYESDELGADMEKGYTGAENAMLIDPDVRLFAAFQYSAGLGVNNFLEAKGVDMTEFGIFCTSEDDTTPAMLKAAEEGKGAIRGTITAGGGVPDTMINTLVMAWKGQVELGSQYIDYMTAWHSDDFECDFTVGEPLVW